MRTLLVIASLVLLAGCGPKDATRPAPVTVEPAATSGRSEPAIAPERAPDASRWVCSIDSKDFMEVRDDGRSVVLSTGPSADGPFTPLPPDLARMAFHEELDGHAFEPPDFDRVFVAAGVPRRDVATMTMYGIAGGSGFSAGIVVLRDAKRRPLGHAGWSMRVVIAHGCRPNAP